MKLQGTLRHGIFFLAAVFVLSLFMAGIVYSADKPKLTPDYLASNTWGVAEACVAIKFTKNGKFEMTDNCKEQCGEFNRGSGSYVIKGDNIVLRIEEGKECSRFKKGDSLNGKLSDENSVEFRWSLSFKEYLIFADNQNTRINAGENVKIKSIDAVSMGSVSGLTTSVLKIREAPGTKEKEITWEGSCDSDTEVYKSIKKDTKLTIFARTKNKDKVVKTENYWYYVKFNKEGICGGSVTGWVFGEFVKIK